VPEKTKAAAIQKKNTEECRQKKPDTAIEEGKICTIQEDLETSRKPSSEKG